MSIGGWLGTGAAVIVAGLCWLLMRYGSHLPSMTHPWQHRAVILGMLAAGTVLTATLAGQWVIREADRLLGLVGGAHPGGGLAWALATIGALFVAATIVVALIWAPDQGTAYIALAAPLVFALAPAGFAHQLFVFISGPANTLVSQLSTWAGG